MRALPLFANAKTRQLRQIAKAAEAVDFLPGEFVVSVGEPGDAFYVIVTGNAKVIASGSPPGATLGPGDFFGEMSLVDGERRSATIVATTELRAMKLGRRAFLKLLEQDSRLALAVMQALAARVRRLEHAV